MRVESKEGAAALAGGGSLAVAGIDRTTSLPAASRVDPDERPVAADGDRPSPGAGGNAVARDQAERDRAMPTTYDLLRHAQKRSGRRPLEMLREFIRLNRGSGRLTWPEYVQYGVYDRDRYDPGEQARFLTNTLHWPITRVCCDMTWQATTEDKWLCGRLLAGSAIRLPETLAVIDRTARAYPDSHKISTAAQLRDFMRSRDVLPLFGKENRGICSLGAFLALDADERAVLLKGRGWVSYEECLEQLVGTTAYLLQRLERNHAFFDRYTDALATIRVCILVSDESVRLPFAILKLPSPDNVADSFWRPGNLACKVDLPTGRIVTVRSRDAYGTTDHTIHPASGEALLGQTLPMWDQVLDLARRCAPIFQPVRYQSMDIGITPAGPVLIEINTGGGFDLPQLASGEGFLTDEVRNFFGACGCDRL
jgi:hypothetical protein